MHENMIFCLENLGLWGALQVSSCSMQPIFMILQILLSCFILGFVLFVLGKYFRYLLVSIFLVLFPVSVVSIQHT